MADDWHTYQEAAAALGMSVEGLRQRVRREHWRKMTGNDGKVRVILPEVSRSPLDRPAGDHADTKVSTRRSPGKQSPVQNSAEIALLQARVEELKAELDRERGERREHQDRADALSRELADMAREMTRIVQDGVAREHDLRDKLDAARSSSWWPFRRSA